MKLIPLTQGKFAMVDDEDYARVIQFKWYAQKRGRTFYAARHLKREGKATTQRLHSFILNLLPGQEVSHEDGNGLNNQNYNIEACTHTKNMQAGMRKSLTASGVYRGVTWDKKMKKYRARACHENKSYHFGFFETALAGAEARDAGARLLGRPESSMNFPR